MRLGAAGLGQGRGEARRALLQQGDVPLGGGEHLGELGDEIAVDLHVGLVSLLDPQQARAPGEEGRVGREVAPVEEVPADGGEFHRRSIRCLKRDFLTGEELGAFELGKLLDRAAALKAGRGGAPRRRRARRAQHRARLREALDPDADLLRGRRRRARRHPDRAARRRDAALARRVDRRHRAGALALRRRDRDPLRLPRGGRRAGRRRRGAGGQRADPAPPSLPGARRPAHPARAPRRARRACASPTSATATTSPARWRSPASWPESRSSSRHPPATSSRRATGRS